MRQGENLAGELKVRIMKNDKSEYPGIVETVSRFAGAFVGTLVVGSKEMTKCVKEITKPKRGSKPEPTSKPKAEPKPGIEPTQKLEPEPMPKPMPAPKASTKVAEKPVKSLPEKKISLAVKVKKKATSRQAKIRKKGKKPKNSSRSQKHHPKSKASAETKVTFETPQTQGPTAEAKQSSGRCSGKKSVRLLNQKKV